MFLAITLILLLDELNVLLIVIGNQRCAGGLIMPAVSKETCRRYQLASKWRAVEFTAHSHWSYETAGVYCAKPFVTLRNRSWLTNIIKGGETNTQCLRSRVTSVRSLFSTDLLVWYEVKGILDHYGTGLIAKTTLDFASHFVTGISMKINACWGILVLKQVLILMEEKKGIWMKKLL